MQQEIKHTWHFSQLPEEVWEYLTRPELLEQWLMKTNFQPIVGHTFYFIGECDHEGKKAAECEVLEIIPNKFISYSWNANSITDNKPFSSKVMWTLIPRDNGTDLQLVHNGFTLLEDALAHNEGWTRIGTKIISFFNASYYENADC